MPVLCISGEKDEVFPPDVLRELVTILLDVRFVTVPGAGHSVYFDTAYLFR